MGFISGLLGGGSGAGFQAAAAPVVSPATAGQADQLYNQSQQGIGQQQAFLSALQGQNGIGNQSSVYNQMQGVANGTGPNPAQAQLAQATGANTANQAALMAGQRGAGANVGLMARQAAMQGGANQQQAAGQAATMQANQSLNALNSMGGIAGQQVANQASGINSLNSATQGEQGQILGAINNQNQNNVAMQSNENTANSQIAATNAKNQSSMLGGALSGLASVGLGAMTGGASTALSAGLGAMSNNKAHGGMIQSYDNGGAVMPAIGPQGVPPTPSGPVSRMGQFLKNGAQQPAPTPVEGDEVRNGLSSLGNTIGYAVGKLTAKDKPIDPNGMGSQFNATPQAPGLGVKTDFGGTPAPDAPSNPLGANVSQIQDTSGGDVQNKAHGGQMEQRKPVPAMVSPGEKYLNPKEAQAVASGQVTPDKVGKVIPGQAKVAGDSLKNDIVPATLEEGGCVIPRSHMKDMSSAIKFVHAHMRMSKAKK